MSHVSGCENDVSAGDLIEAAISANREEHPAVGAGRELRLASEEISGYALATRSGFCTPPGSRGEESRDPRFAGAKRPIFG
jgi:hypothetical protein